MNISKFIQVNQNALIEIIHDDVNLYRDFDYNIIKDAKNNNVSFCIKDTTDLNNINNQLFPIDKTLNKYGVIDFNKYSFLSKNEYTNNSPSLYNKVKIWFPINYNFSGTNGFYCNIYSLDFDNNIKYDFSNFFLDISNQQVFNSIELEQTPFRMNDKLWGKSITLFIPNLNYEAQQRINGQAKVGTINYNLTGIKGLSTTAPIYFDFRFLYNKRNVLNEISYLTTSQVLFSTPQAPSNINLSVSIEPAIDGDYFIINGKYNNSAGELEQYMNMLSLSGNNSYILYSITVYENNMPQSTRDIYVYDNYSVGINDYRPVIKYTNTLASIRIDMKIISTVDNTMDIKTTEYILTGNEVAKYGKRLATINIANAIKPKIYNSAPTQVNLPTQDIINSYFKRKVNKKLELRYIPYPVLFNVADIAIKNIEGNTNINLNENLNIILKPFDNVFKFNLIDYSDPNTYKNYSIPVENTIINMVFKNDALSVRIPLFTESNEIDLNNGIVIFKISESDLTNIKKINSTSSNWYITLLTNNIETVIYTGKFEFEKKITNTSVPNTTSNTISNTTFTLVDAQVSPNILSNFTNWMNNATFTPFTQTVSPNIVTSIKNRFNL